MYSTRVPSYPTFNQDLPDPSTNYMLSVVNIREAMLERERNMDDRATKMANHHEKQFFLIVV